MTSVEPGILDTNILVYAVDADAPQHGSSRALLDAARDAVSTTLYVTSQILCEFYSKLINPRRVAVPRSSTEAFVRFQPFSRFKVCRCSRHRNWCSAIP
jgi:predicted nucleic acid-binding protein